uniref:Uncharacterized protein n=1 Tax=Anopheles atroparvus TaxID=41427 RepID=A0A182JLQ0_ANOAO
MEKRLEEKRNDLKIYDEFVPTSLKRNDKATGRSSRMMKTKQTSAMLLIVFYVRASFMKICYRDDPELGKCIKNSLQYMLPEMQTGIEALGFPALDPFEATIAKLDHYIAPVESMTMQLEVKNAKTFGLSQANIQNVRASASDQALTLNAKIRFPQIVIEADVNTTWKMAGQVTELNGEEYLQIESFAMTPKVGNLKIYSSSVYPDPWITRGMYCAGGEPGVSGCNGDSGGGMFFEKDDTWFIGGIISFIAKRPNTNLCDSSKYTIFTDVGEYLEWIKPFISESPAPSITAPLEPCKEGTIRNGSMCTIVDPFLLIASFSKIIRVPLNGGQSFSVTRAKARGLDSDCAEGRLYWSVEKNIHSAKYDGTDRKPFITEDIIDPKGVAVDWTSRRLYWYDWVKETIEVASLENPNVRTVLISKDLDDNCCRSASSKQIRTIASKVSVSSPVPLV